MTVAKKNADCTVKNKENNVILLVLLKDFFMTETWLLTFGRLQLSTNAWETWRVDFSAHRPGCNAGAKSARSPARPSVWCRYTNEPTGLRVDESSRHSLVSFLPCLKRATVWCREREWSTAVSERVIFTAGLFPFPDHTTSIFLAAPSASPGVGNNTRITPLTRTRVLLAAVPLCYPHLTAVSGCTLETCSTGAACLADTPRLAAATEATQPIVSLAAPLAAWIVGQPQATGACGDTGDEHCSPLCA